MSHFNFKKINHRILTIIYLFLLSFFVHSESAFAIDYKNILNKHTSTETLVYFTNLYDLEKDIKKISKKYVSSIAISDIIKDLKIAKISSSEFSQDNLQLILLKLNSVIMVEENMKRVGSFIPNDPIFYRQWYHKNIGQNINGINGKENADINTNIAWDTETIDAKTIVAIIDSGVAYEHDDLSKNMWDGTSCVNDKNVPIIEGCPFHGWNYVDDNDDPNDIGHPVENYNGHGTFVASQLASITNNSSGISGMSRYNNIKMMAIKFNFDIFSEIKAINFAKNNGAKVINASFGGEGYSQIEKDAIDSFNGVFVVASGNGGKDLIGDSLDEHKFYPCSYESENIICVAATNQNDEIASFSNYGIDSVDIAAPGVNMYGIYRNEFTYGNGTSFASPLVSGVSALLYNKKPDITIKDIITNIKNSGTYIASLKSKVSSSRRLNANNALSFVIDTDTTNDINKIPIFRLYNTKTGAHLYTRGVNDRNKILNKYPVFEFTDGEPAFYASLTNDGTTPIYRLYNTKTKVHLYTRGVNDRNKILNKYPVFEFTDGEPAFYASLTNDGTTPIYRLYNTKTKVHLYTRGVNDRNKILNKYPVFEFTDGEPAFYASLTHS